MRKCFHLRCLLLLTLALFTLCAQATTPRPVANEPIAGIRFFTGSWSAVLAEAKKQNKPIFIDVYTSWCGPCKVMARQAFPDKAVGDLFNANFVSYQIDAEKGEGIDVAKKYAVTAYPTSLYVSANGDLIHRVVGYMGIKPMLDEANKAVEAAKDPKPIAIWDKEFAEGKRDADFLKTYLGKRAKLGMPNAEALEAYLKAVPEAELTSPESIEVMSGNLTTSTSRAFDLLVRAAQATMMDPAKQPMAQDALRTAYQTLARDEQRAKTEAEVEAVIAKRATLNPALNAQPGLNDNVWLGFYERTKNVPKHREYAVKSASKLMAVPVDSLKVKDGATYQRFLDQTQAVPDSIKKSENFIQYAKSMKTIETQQVATQLNSLAWGYFEGMATPADLKQALTWSERSLELIRSAAFLDTYAQLLGKLGRKADAIKYEEEAIAKAKAASEETADYEKTLTALKK